MSDIKKFDEMNDTVKEYVKGSEVYGTDENGYVVDIENERVDEGDIEEFIEYKQEEKNMLDEEHEARFTAMSAPETSICGACQAVIKPGKEILVTMEKFTPHERTWPACSEECVKILKGRE